MNKGFSTKEGLLAIGGLAGSAVVAIIGFGDRFYLTILFLALISIFFTIYGRKLCRICEKSCPCNPNMFFWKQVLRDLKLKK